METLYLSVRSVFVELSDVAVARLLDDASFFLDGFSCRSV